MTFVPTERRPRRLLLALGLAAGLIPGCLAAVPASAQFFIDEPEVRVSPRGVVMNLVRRGYRDVTPPFFDGDTYSLEAADPRGLRVRLVIDAYDGAILERLRAEVPPIPPRLVGRPALPGYGWTDEEPVPEAAPPRRVERARPRVASASPTAVPVQPLPGVPTGSETSPAPTTANPLGLNPDAARPARVEPKREARRSPATPASAAPSAAPAAPIPSVGTVTAPPPTPKTFAADTLKPSEAPARPVRVIGGVTNVPSAPSPVPTPPQE